MIKVTCHHFITSCKNKPAGVEWKQRATVNHDIYPQFMTDNRSKDEHLDINEVC